MNDIRQEIEKRAMIQVNEIRRLRDDNNRLRQALNPRMWTNAQHKAWHRAIPDTIKAFAALLQESEV